MLGSVRTFMPASAIVLSTTPTTRVLMLLELALVATRVVATIVFPVYDDAFIIFRYAKNLAEGAGFVYEPGSRVLGVTSPLFGVLLAPIYLLRLPMPSTIVAANVLVDALVLWLAFRAFVRVEQTSAGVVFGLLFAASPMLARASAGGLETEVFLLALLGSVLLYHAGRPATAVALAAASAFLRPEAGLLVLVILVLQLRRRAADVPRLILVAVLVALPPALLLHFYYGSVVPQSVTAKARLINSPLPHLFTTLIVPEPLALVLLPIAIVGGLYALRQKSAFYPLTLWCCAYVGSYLIARPYVFSWYSAPVQFTMILLASLGAVQIAERFGRRRILDALASRRCVAAGVGAVVVCWGVVCIVMGPSSVTRSVFNPIREYCRESIRPGATILATDIGVIGYYSEARILDTMGLVWPPALRFKRWADIVSAYAPEYLFVYATRDIVSTIKYDPAFRDYTAVRRFSRHGVSDITLNPTLYPPVSWTQDYILLERNNAR